MALSIGTRLGSYEITGSLGAGGMGEVYRARDTKLGRDVAIKTLPAALANDHDRLARFEREAKLLAALNHAHIAAVYGLDEHDCTQYLVMELVEGETLESKLEHGALPLDEALHLALQVAAALEAAHDKGVVHRDLKPANVMITRDGVVKVLDFGLAKAFAGDPGRAIAAHSPALSAAMAQQGLILGTAGYMAPEQASGQPTDQRADIWAFGVLLYEMLTGLPLFSGESVPHILAAVLQTEPDWTRLPTHLHPRLRLLLERCLEKKLRNRYHSMADVRVDIEQVLADPQGGRVAGSGAPPLWRRALLPAGALVLGLLLATVYRIGDRAPASEAELAPPPRVSRLEITLPASAPIASLGSLNLIISPDGRRIAYVAESPDTGLRELYVRELDGLEARPLAGTEAQGVVNPFFSADGQSIGFWVPERRGVFSAALDGRPTTELFEQRDFFIGAAWAADNSLIFSSDQRLERISAGGGGTPEPLTPPRDIGYPAAPVLLPGGRAVLFHDVSPPNESVAALDLATGEERILVEGAGAPAYSDTGHVLFMRGTTLMAVPFDVAELTVTGEPVALVQGIRTRGAGQSSDYTLSANGTLAYVRAPDESVAGSAVVWVDRTGNVVGRAVDDLLTWPRDPSLSPDGTHLLLVTGPVTDGDVWSYDLRGRPPIPLGLPGDNRSPVWSPDGRQVAFARNDEVGAIVVAPADGSVLAPPALPGARGLPQFWSATGELAVYGFGGAGNILAFSVAGSGERVAVVATDFGESDAALSPNGRWLAYATTRTGTNEVWVQGYPDGVAVRVSTNGGYEPRWSADGHELFYLAGSTMMSVAVDTDGDFSFDAPARLFSGSFQAYSGPLLKSYDVARDGRFLMIEPAPAASETQPASIVVVQNFAEEIRARFRRNAP